MEASNVDSLLNSVLSPFADLAARAPRTPLFSFVDDHGRDADRITAGELADAAEQVAAAIRGWGIAPGERVLLVYPPSIDFIRALAGCLVAGAVPVPVYPPNPFTLKRDLASLAATASGCGATHALTNTGYDRIRQTTVATGLLRRDGARWPALRWHRTDRGLARAAGAVTWHRPASPDEPALLQYTSGSTSAPRGVAISHRNLLAEIAANAADLGLGASARGVFWLPQYHDFGLISVILSSMAGNSQTTLLSPLTFMQRPAVWFEVMSRVRGTHTAAPNFAFDLAVRKTTPEQRRGWDLSCLRVVMSAAEPIRPATVDAFHAAFAVTGLRPEAFYPAYGLAEHTVSVTMGGRARLRLDPAELGAGRVVPAEGRDAVEYVGCGRATKAGTTLLIVDPATCRPCGPGQVGEIWVDSPTKALGYHGLPEESERAFRARVAGDGGGTTYLRTGDLGFLHGGELFVTGRRKDVVILNGRNFYPADLEDTVRDCHPLVRPGGLAAFSVDGGAGESLVLFVETRTDRVGPDQVAAVADAVRDALYAAHRLPCPVVVVGPAGLVRKTTSGKVRRGSCREAYLSGQAQAARGVVVSHLAAALAGAAAGPAVLSG
jgi:acyl-CoA synthetase (AMP-forming)/AMP-acid ligase II